MPKLLRSLLVSLVLAASFLSAAYVATPAAYSQDQEIVYVGSAKSNKYHHPYCVWAKKINPDNLVTFSGKEEAASKGYVPCKVCKP